MNELLSLAVPLAAGVLLGAIFFGGLWWTVVRAVSSPRPALWFIGSKLLRMGVALGGLLSCRGRRLAAMAAVPARLCPRAPRHLAPDPFAGAKPRPAERRRPAMRLSPDDMIFWRYGFLKLNGTIVFTWALMFVLAVGSKLVTRKLSTDLERSPWQNLLEIIVTGIEKQIADVGLRNPGKYIGFLGTLFLFVALASLCTIIPGYEPPTGSLSTTAALALCVFVAVPFFGIQDAGAGRLPQILR